MTPILVNAVSNVIAFFITALKLFSHLTTIVANLQIRRDLNIFNLLKYMKEVFAALEQCRYKMNLQNKERNYKLFEFILKYLMLVSASQLLTGCSGYKSL